MSGGGLSGTRSEPSEGRLKGGFEDGVETGSARRVGVVGDGVPTSCTLDLIEAAGERRVGDATGPTVSTPLAVTEEACGKGPV
jgi:hypothetical protein